VNRRDLIALLGSTAATWPLGARAQYAGIVHRIGFLGSATAAGSAKAVESLRTGLRDHAPSGSFAGVEGPSWARWPRKQKPDL
jgi:hypothetical protein